MAIMQVSRKVDYALRAVIHLANEEAPRSRVLGRGDRGARAHSEEVPREDHPGPDPHRSGALDARAARRLHPRRGRPSR